MKNLKILVCVRRLDRGGTEILECRLARELNRMGVNTHVACQYDERMEHQMEAAQHWRKQGIPKVHCLGAKGIKGQVRALFRLGSLVRRENFDAVITTNTGLDTIGVFARFLRARFLHVAAFHAYVAKEVFSKPRIVVWRHLLSGVDACYSISEYVRNSIHYDTGVPLRQNYRIYNSIDVDDLEIREDREGVRQELGLAPDAKILLYLGRLQYLKGCDLMVSLLGPKLESWNAYLVIVGPVFRNKALGKGALNFDKEIFQIIERLSILERIKIIGFRNDVGRLMASSDILIHLARREGFGLVLLEAIAAGLPIVASNRGGIPEVLRDTPYRPVSLENPEAILREVEKWLFMNPHIKRKHVETAYQVLDYFSDNRRASEVLALINKKLDDDQV